MKNEKEEGDSQEVFGAGEGKGREAGTGAEQDREREQERDHQTRAEPLAKPGAGLDGELKVVPTAAGLRSVGDTTHPGGGHRRVATMASGTVRDGGVCCGCCGC
ncbi:hypothetical protein WR25_18552 [Diploscapter pachys]|uniref:Uncharacterized protein n=1 Tax=Diploscapter pachys TaxID=2018661 RepID=A0A2A2LL34_9BILA|nr:hypothetical protein WR25_18552 [Diploscapter pachys]